MTRCAVLGSPITHSLSPALHRAAYAELGLTDWSYDRYEVDEQDLAGFVTGLDREWRGLSMTKPLKAAALALGEADEQVRLSGAANTMILSADRGRQLHNTDIDGLTHALLAAGIDAVAEAVILGAGGTTRAALVSLSALGADRVRVLARRPEQAAALAPLAQRLGIDLRPGGWGDELGSADLVISTVTAEAAAGRADQLGRVGAVFDVVYDPWPTPLARAAEAAGCSLVNGLDLLVHQAVGQVELMTGRQVSPEVLMSAGRKALGARKPA